jgi:tetratricopeptide (TPR) repeat protein
MKRKYDDGDLNDYRPIKRQKLKESELRFKWELSTVSFSQYANSYWLALVHTVTSSKMTMPQLSLAKLWARFSQDVQLQIQTEFREALAKEQYDLWITSLLKFGLYRTIKVHRNDTEVLNSIQPDVDKLLENKNGFISANLLALLYNTLGTSNEDDFKESDIVYFTRAIELRPNYAVAYNNRGNAYSSFHKYRESSIDYETAIKLEPSYSNAYSNRGGLLDDTGDTDGALEQFTFAIKIDCTNETAYFNRAIIYKQMSKYVNALSDLSIAHKNDPEFIFLYRQELDHVKYACVDSLGI